MSSASATAFVQMQDSVKIAEIDLSLTNLESSLCPESIDGIYPCYRTEKAAQRETGLSEEIATSAGTRYIPRNSSCVQLGTDGIEWVAELGGGTAALTFASHLIGGGWNEANIAACPRLPESRLPSAAHSRDRTMQVCSQLTWFFFTNACTSSPTV